MKNTNAKIFYIIIINIIIIFYIIYIYNLLIKFVKTDLPT